MDKEQKQKLLNLISEIGIAKERVLDIMFQLEDNCKEYDIINDADNDLRSALDKLIAVTNS